MRGAGPASPAAGGHRQPVRVWALRGGGAKLVRELGSGEAPRRLVADRSTERGFLLGGGLGRERCDSAQQLFGCRTFKRLDLQCERHELTFGHVVDGPALLENIRCIELTAAEQLLHAALESRVHGVWDPNGGHAELARQFTDKFEAGARAARSG